MICTEAFLKEFEQDEKSAKGGIEKVSCCWGHIFKKKHKTNITRSQGMQDVRECLNPVFKKNLIT